MLIQEVQLQLNEAAAFVGDCHFDTTTPSSRIDVSFIDLGVNKLEDILNTCVNRHVRALFLTGDIFSRIQMPAEGLNKIGATFLRFKKEGIRVFSILGNHDFVRNNLDALDRSPLAVLFSLEVIEHINLENRVVINKRILVTPVDYTEYPTKAVPKAKGNILLAHMFYNASELMADARHNLNEDNIRNLGYDGAFLGHDHVWYPKSNVCGCDIIRPGSVIRGTMHDYNFERPVQFAILNEPWNYNPNNWEYVNIAHKDFKEVVSTSVLNRKLGTLAGMKDLMNDLVEKLAKNQDKYDNILDRVLKDTSITPEIRALLMQYFVNAGISA